jgi:glycosyltransferase involved in cell wall biosynthesis
LPDAANEERLPEFLAGDERTVVYFGKLLRNKGVHVLLDALAGVDARVVIVGFGDYRTELEDMARGRHVLFTGPLDHRHLVHLLALADACVVPSIFPEAFGMVAAEAAAAGCPPLVARHSGLAEVADGLEAEYPTALRGLASFTSGDTSDLRRKLTRLLELEDPERESIRAAARRAAIERWSWASVADRLLTLGR